MDFRPLAEAERRQLLTALRGNADRGVALLLDRRDTSFTGTAEDLPALEKAASDAEPLIAEHAQWAIGEIRKRGT